MWEEVRTGGVCGRKTLRDRGGDRETKKALSSSCVCACVCVLVAQRRQPRLTFGLCGEWSLLRQPLLIVGAMLLPILPICACPSLSLFLSLSLSLSLSLPLSLPVINFPPSISLSLSLSASLLPSLPPSCLSLRMERRILERRRARAPDAGMHKEPYETIKGRILMRKKSLILPKRPNIQTNLFLGKQTYFLDMLIF